MNWIALPLLLRQASKYKTYVGQNKFWALPPSRDMSGVALQLAVVDRHFEIERLIRTAELNHARGTDGKPLLDKPLLLYSSQVFGSGKTTFGTYASSLLRDKVVVDRLLHPPPAVEAGTIPGDLVDMRRDQTFTKDLVESYTNSKTIFVDLKEGLVKSPSSEEKGITFQEAFYHAAYCSVVGRITVDQFFKEVKTIDPDSIMRLLVEKTGHKGKWFFFTDEIGYTERIASDYHDIKNPAEHITTKTQHTDVYTRLFDILQPFITREDCFAFCAGKSASLTEKSLEDSGSPLRLRLLALSALQPEYIIEVMQKTMYKGKTLQQALGVPDDLLPVFAETVYLYTGGIPRLIRRVFESLISRNVPVPQNKAEIIKVMNDKVRDDIVSDLSSFFRPEYMSSDAVEVYTTMLLMSILHVKIRRSTVIRIGPEQATKFVLDWISNLCLYISPDGPETYKLVFSQFLIDYLQKYPPHGEQRIALLASLLDQLRSLPSMVDQGRILEVLLAQALAFQLAFASTFGEIPGLQDTMLRDVAVARNVGKGFGARFLPSFQSKTTAGTPKMEDGAIKSYNPADWDKFYLHLFEDNNINVVGISREKNSNGPDVAIIVQDTPPGAPGQFPDIIYQCGIASKNLQSDGTTNWGDIKDEIEKGLKTPLHNEALKGKLRAVLVIASTKLMGEIETAVDGKPYVVCNAGTWAYHKKTGKLEKGKSDDGWVDKFTVPQNGELVILSKSGMAALLGNSTLDTLSAYFSRGEDERCENLLSMEQALGSVMRKRKHVAVAGSNQFALSVPGRTIEVTFKDSTTKAAIGSGMADIPFGTTLSSAKSIIGGVLNKKVTGRTIVGLEWEGVPLSDDNDMHSVQHRDEVVVLLQ